MIKETAPNRPPKYLTDKRYKDILNHLYEFNSKRNLENHLNKAHDYYIEDNPKFFLLLSQTLSHRFSLDDEELSTLLVHIADRDELNSRKEKEAFIFDLISKRIEVLLDSKRVKNRRYLIKDIPAIEETLTKFGKLEGVRARMTASDHYLLFEKFIRLISSFEPKDIKMETSTESLKILVTSYFKIALNYSPFFDQTDILLSNIYGKRKAGYVDADSKMVQRRAEEIFFKNNLVFIKNSKNRQSEFSIFKKLEMDRWKKVKELLGPGNDEFEILEKYIKKVRIIYKGKSQQYTEQNKSFGIIRDERLIEFIADLTAAIRFINIPDLLYNDMASRHQSKRKTEIREYAEHVVSVLTCSDYEKTKGKIYFGCETTTIAFVFDVIRTNFSINKGLNPKNIAASQCFYISKLRKVSGAKEKKIADKGFDPLNFSNIKQSLGRFLHRYSIPETIENEHFIEIQPILKRLQLKYEL